MRDVQADDIVYIDRHACKVPAPPSHLDGLSGAGYEDAKDEKVILVRGTGVIDGEEHSGLYGLDGQVECFVDRPDEREWLVVLLYFFSS